MYRSILININKALSLLLLFFTLFSCQEIDLDESEIISNSIMESPKSWLDTLCSRTFEGRKVGTQGNKRAALFLYNEVKKMGYAPEIQKFAHSSGDTLRNVIIQKKGVNDSLIIIGAHFDGQHASNNKVHYEAANDNASGVVTLLSILDSIARVDLKYSIMAVFFDGEESCVPPAFKGSSYFVNNLNEKEKVVLYINIDAMGHNHDNQMILGWFGSHRVLKVVDRLKKEKKFNYSIKERIKGEGASDYKSFSLVGIPYISYTDISLSCDYPQHDVRDSREAVNLSRLLKVRDLSIEICNCI